MILGEYHEIDFDYCWHSGLSHCDAASIDGSYQIVGSGNAQCSALVARDDFVSSTRYAQWFFGYVTAAAKAGEELTGQETVLNQNLEKNSTAEMLDWAKEYCEDNPSKTLEDAAERFVSNAGQI